MSVTVRTLTACIAAIVWGISGDLYSAANIETDTAGSKKLQVSRTLLEEAPDEFRNQFLPRSPAPHQTVKSPGHYSVDDWKNAIDTTWGPGPSAGIKAARFDLFWNTIDDSFACFQDLDINWDSIGDHYSSEINDSTVSRGRFAAIMDHATRTLKEAHTMSRDSVVYFTQPAPGVPLMFVGGWGANDHFGAGLTPLSDSSLLVYRTVTNHPLGLVPGDIVLGYDGIPWKQSYRELLEVELPVTGFWWGSSESSHTHSWLMAAGLNWHLFDMIDIVKYNTGDTLHLATDLLVGQDMYLWATEQMDIPGVPFPDLSVDELITYDVIEGTDIGYIYSLGWFIDGVESDWSWAIASLSYGTTGMIIDLRTCYGGNPAWTRQGFGYLFDRCVDEIGIDMRADPDDHFSMQPTDLIPDDWFKIDGDSTSYYDKPIAVLIGPGSISMGDLAALLLTFHPSTRLFGKPTSAAFNSPDAYSAGADFFFRYSRSETYLFLDSGHYLTHDEFPNAIDFPWVSFQEVWLTPDGVAAGKDDVVEAAIAWINATTAAGDEPEENLPESFALLQNYPNPFNLSTTVSFDLPSRSRVVITVYNVVGQVVTTLLDEVKQAGRYDIKWDGKDQHGETIASGVYLYEMRAGEYTGTRKMLLLK